jgi:serine/threonine-protein kinase RsbW
MTEPDEVVTLSLPTQSRFIRLARLVGAGLANDLGIDLDGLDDVRLAIGEACGLAAQFGATAIDLRFSLVDSALVVRGGGSTDGTTTGSSPGADDEQLRLVRQILDVACAQHELTVNSSGLSFSLSFTHGS